MTADQIVDDADREARASSASTMWLPMKPAPPVTTARACRSCRLEPLQQTDVVVAVVFHAVRQLPREKRLAELAHRILDGVRGW